MQRRLFLLSACAAAAWAQEPPEAPVEFICPMDREVRSPEPGRCPRCGMTLIPGIPDPVEYPLTLAVNPANPAPGQKVRLSISVRNPKTGRPVTDYEVVHEKLFHLFAVGQDLQFFLHDHPVYKGGGDFELDVVFPSGGMYRLLTDFYPKGGTPQLITRTVIVSGGQLTPGARLQADLLAKKTTNTKVSVTLTPETPIAGLKTMMFFHLDPADGFEKYLGAWGHMLVTSGDLVDMIHTHPFLADGGPVVQFNLIFPRPGVYRVWMQFQRKGTVNTAVFNVPVVELS